MADNSEDEIDASTENSATGGGHPSLLVMPHLEVVRQDSNPIPPSPTTGQPPLQYGATHPGVSFENESDSDQTCSECQPTDEPVDKTTLDCSFKDLNRNREVIEGSLQQYEFSTKERQTKIHSLETELEQKELDYADREHRFIEDIDTLSQQLNNKQTEHRSAVERVDELMESLDKEKKLVDRLIYDQVTLQNEFDTLCSDKTVLTMSVEEMIEHINATSLEKEELAEDNRDLTDTKINLEEKQSCLKNQLNELEKQKELETKAHSEELERINEAINAKSEANHSLNTELEAVKQRCAELDHQCRGTLEELQHSTQECENLKRQLMSASIEVGQLNGETTNLIQENVCLEEKLRKEATKSDGISQELEGKKKDIVKLKEFQSNQASELATKVNEIKTSKQECTALQDKLKQSNTDTEGLAKEKQELTSKYKRLETSHKSSIKKLEEKEKEITDLKNEISTLNDEVEDLVSESNNLKKEMNALKQECLKLKNQLKDSKTEIAQCHSREKQLQTEKNRIMDQLTELDTFSKQTLETLEEREREINALKESHSAVVKGLEDAMSEEVEKSRVEKLDILAELSESRNQCERLNMQLQYIHRNNTEKSVLEKEREDLIGKIQSLEADRMKIADARWEEIAKLEQSRSTQNGNPEETLASMSKSIETMKDEKQSLKEEINSWEQEYERLNLIIKDFEEINSQNSKLNQEREELIGIIKGLQTSVDRIGGELEERREENSRLRLSHSIETSTLENKIEMLNEEKERTLDEVNASKQLCQELKILLTEKCNEGEEANSELSNLRNEKQELFEQYQSKIIELGNTEGDKLKLGIENSENISRIMYLTDQLQEQAKLSISLKEMISKTERESQENSAMLDLSFESLSKIEETFLSLCGYLPSDLSLGSAERVEWLVASMTSWNAELNTKISDIESLLHEKQSEKLQVELQRGNLRKHYSTESTKNDRLMQDNADLERRVQTLMSEKDELERKNVELENKLTEIQETLENSNTQLSELMRLQNAQNQALDPVSTLDFEPSIPLPDPISSLSQGDRSTLQKAASELSQLKVKVWRLEDENHESSPCNREKEALYKDLEFLRKRVEELEVCAERYKLSIEVKEVASKELYEECRDWERKCGHMQHEMEKMKRQLFKKDAETQECARLRAERLEQQTTLDNLLAELQERKKAEMILQKNNQEFRSHLEDCLRYIETLPTRGNFSSTESPNIVFHLPDISHPSPVDPVSPSILELSPLSPPSTIQVPIFYPPNSFPKT